jgi:hypothetical protein
MVIVRKNYYTVLVGPFQRKIGEFLLKLIHRILHSFKH